MYMLFMCTAYTILHAIHMYCIYMLFMCAVFIKYLVIYCYIIVHVVSHMNEFCVQYVESWKLAVRTGLDSLAYYRKVVTTIFGGSCGIDYCLAYRAEDRQEWLTVPSNSWMTEHMATSSQMSLLKQFTFSRPDLVEKAMCLRQLINKKNQLGMVETTGRSLSSNQASTCLHFCSGTFWWEQQNSCTCHCILSQN